MQILDNRIYPDLYPETIWDITSETEKEIFGFTLPKPSPKILKFKPIESEEEKEIFKDYYRNILKDYKSRGVIPWFKF